MSILIKGKDKPTSCRACMYSRTDIRNVEWCVLTEKDLPCDCPIIEVLPHGRLIDADVLWRQLAKLPQTWEYGEAIADCIKWIEESPTIIPPEEGE